VKITAKLLDFYISVGPVDKQRNYNQHAIPAFYTLLFMLVSQSTEYLEKVLFHSNFEWALKYLYYETQYHIHTSSVIFDILKLGCDYPNFREKYIRIIIEKIPNSPYNALRFLDILLKTQQDILNFCSRNGIEMLSQFLENRHENERDPEFLAHIIQMSLDLLIRSISWMTTENLSQEMETIKFNSLQQWNSKLGLLTQVISFTKHFTTKPGIMEGSFKIILFLSRSDNLCLTTALRHLATIMTPKSSTQMDIESKVQLNSFYEMAKKICEIGLSNKNALSESVELAIVIARDTLNNPNLSASIITLLQQIWSNQQLHEYLVSNKYIESLIIRILTVTNWSENPKTEEFLNQVKIEVALTQQKQNNIRHIMIIKIEGLTKALQTIIDGSDMTVVQTSILQLIQAFKVLKFLIGQENKTY